MLDKLDKLENGIPIDKIVKDKAERTELEKHLTKEIKMIEKKKRAIEKIASLEEQLRTGQFKQKTPKQEETDYQLDKIRRRQKLLELEVRERMQKKTIGGMLLDQYNNVVRPIQASGDLPYGRQLLSALFSRPGLVLQGVPSTLKAQVSEKWESESRRVRESHPMYEDSVMAGIRYGAETEHRSASWLHDVHGIKQYIERGQGAFDTAVDNLRFNLYLLLTENLSLTGVPTTQEKTDIALMVNVFTGSGEVGSWANIGSRIFYSPRYTMSRIQFMSGLPLRSASTRRVQKLILKEYLRFAMGRTLATMMRMSYEIAKTGATVSLASFLWAALVGDEDDIRSSGYGKLELGEDMHVDFGSGYAQWMTFFSRVATGTSVSAEGKESALYGEDNKFGQRTIRDLYWYMLETKQSPVMNQIIGVTTRQDLLGENTNIAELEGQKNLGLRQLPILAMDVYEILWKSTNESELEKAAALVFGYSGFGVNVYDPTAPR
jgi:hypothetical protein